MNISFYTPSESRTTTVGYGNAGFNMVTSLQALGHKVPFDDPTCPVQICFSNPYNYKFYPGQYKIGYTPWESTHVPAYWVDNMNKCDEIWATSEWVRDVYVANNVKPPVYIYEHGIDSRWQPTLRTPGQVTKFLHIGEPALRKGGQMTLDAFRDSFGDRTDVHLTFKVYYQHHLRTYSDTAFQNAANAYNNVTIINQTMNDTELVALYAEHDVMVYPTYGEGFGFIPLQALATGMPVISTYDWAPYAKYLSPLAVKSRPDRSIWSVHPGDVYYPNYENLKSRMKDFQSEAASYHKIFYDQAPQVIAEYDWLTKTEQAFSHIVERFTDN